MEIEYRKNTNIYTGNLIRKYELLDDILQSIREENEFRAMAAMNDRNEIPIADIMHNELLQWQYECVQLKALFELTVRRMGVRALFLNSVNTEFMHRIGNAKKVEECKKINQDMVHRYCSLAALRENKKYSPLVQRVIFVTGIDISKNLTLQYFADMMNVNKCYLSDLFKRETGMTITEYVNRKRVIRAADMLLMTQHSVHIIGEEVGIQDVHYFSRLFKKYIGMTPTMYRESMHESEEGTTLVPLNNNKKPGR